MNARAIVLFLLLACSAIAADLPTVTVEHLYFLATRGEQVGKLNDEEMVRYILAGKLGSSTFESLNDQILQMRIELVTMTTLNGVPEDDPRVMALKRKRDVYQSLLSEEARKIQRGLIREGSIADETLRSIARAQQGR